MVVTPRFTCRDLNAVRWRESPTLDVPDMGRVVPKPTNKSLPDPKTSPNWANPFLFKNIF